MANRRGVARKWLAYSKINGSAVSMAAHAGERPEDLAKKAKKRKKYSAINSAAKTRLKTSAACESAKSRNMRRKRKAAKRRKRPRNTSKLAIAAAAGSSASMKAYRNHRPVISISENSINGGSMVMAMAIKYRSNVSAIPARAAKGEEARENHACCSDG
jgi:hypothetical protein